VGCIALPSGHAPGHAWGFASALAAAITWAAYSVLSRRLATVPSEAVGSFCGATAVLAALCHLALESTVWPTGCQWLAVLAMATGPVGFAFFAWDIGMKRGDIRVLGACGYLTPLLSTGLLVAFGRAHASWLLAFACLSISGGAATRRPGCTAPPGVERDCSGVAPEPHMGRKG
jgi:drug/metabolite transporter (DMT)-like permease